MIYEQSLIAEKIEELIRKGYPKDYIQKHLKEFSDESFSIAKARIKNKQEEKINSKYLFNEEDLRFCTNQQVASYRAERLKCDVIVDIGCGIGIQAIEFAKKCSKVIAIEIDKRKIELAKFNAKAENVSNIEFVCADALEALDKIKKADVVFWDPERPHAEAERTLDSLKPSFSDLFDKVKKISESFAVELPPQIEREKIKQDCEFEYISLNGKLNRLNAYFGKIKKCNVSVVSLPVIDKIEYFGEKFNKPHIINDFKAYLYEVDDAVARSGLFDFFVSKFRDFYAVDFGGKTYLTSAVLVKNSFLKSYQVIGNCGKNKIRGFLDVHGVGKVIMHGKIDEKEYSEMRRKLQFGLKFKKEAHLFFGKEFVVAGVKV